MKIIWGIYLFIFIFCYLRKYFLLKKIYRINSYHNKVNTHVNIHKKTFHFINYKNYHSDAQVYIKKFNFCQKIINLMIILVLLSVIISENIHDFIIDNFFQIMLL